MLFFPWRNKSVDLLCEANTFEKSLNMRKSFICTKLRNTNTMLNGLIQLNTVLATEDLSDAFVELAPYAQQTKANDENEESLESETCVQFNSERPIEQREYDKFAEIGKQ